MNENLFKLQLEVSDLALHLYQLESLVPWCIQ